MTSRNRTVTGQLAWLMVAVLFVLAVAFVGAGLFVDQRPVEPEGPIGSGLDLPLTTTPQPGPVPVPTPGGGR